MAGAGAGAAQEKFQGKARDCTQMKGAAVPAVACSLPELCGLAALGHACLDSLRIQAAALDHHLRQAAGGDREMCE